MTSLNEPGPDATPSDASTARSAAPGAAGAPDAAPGAAPELRALAAARIAVGILLDGGVQHVVVSPGSRSAPMAYALAEAAAQGRVELLVRIDERAAGFTALGLALATGSPAAVLTTSGTAVGNLLPAVMEANHAAVPLIVLSADLHSRWLGVVVLAASLMQFHFAWVIKPERGLSAAE